MKKVTFTLGIIYASLMLQPLLAKQFIFTSSYTSINQKDCMTLDSDNLGSIQECEPFAHIGVKVIEGDIQQSIILTRNRKEYVLDLTGIIGSRFSLLGSKIEWRHELGKPENLKGLIVRFEVSHNHEQLEDVSSYLLVSKVLNDEVCVVAKVVPQNYQAKRAREILDSQQSLPCIK